MQVETTPATSFPSLPESLPSQTLHQQQKPTTATENSESPTLVIPDLPKNAYGLESFSDYCSAVDRVKAGLPPIEAVTPPDRSAPVIIQGIKFKYWDPNHSESDISDTDSEVTAFHPAEVENGNAKSTWSAGTPRRSILRQSTSSPLVHQSEVPLPQEGQNQLVYDYASSASPSSRFTSRLSSRRVSIDAGVQSEHAEVQNDKEEVVRVAAAKRMSARRSSVVPARRRSVVHALAGFTGIGRADSGAVICVANGKNFELVVNNYDRGEGNEIAVQCSGLDIDAEIEALFGEGSKEEVIDVDAEGEAAEPGDKKGEQTATQNFHQDIDMEANTRDKTYEEAGEIPSPEQLRSNNVAFMTPEAIAIPDLDNNAVTDRENGKTTPTVFTPTNLSLRSDAQDVTREGIVQDEIVATSAHTANKRLIPPSTSTPKARVSAPPRLAVSQRVPLGSVPASQPEAQSPETAPPDVKVVEHSEQTPVPATTVEQPEQAAVQDSAVEQPQQHSVRAIADPTNTPASQPIALSTVRQPSLSLKPEDAVPLTAQPGSSQTIQSRTLQLGAVRGVNVCPTASAYQLAAMATLSPRSYLRIIQPSRPRVVFAFASPGGTAPVGGVDVAPPRLMSTPPVATLAVAPNSAARTSMVAAPRRSQVSIPRTELSTPSQDLRPVNGIHQKPESNTVLPRVDLETETLITRPLLQRTAEITESEHLAPRRTGSTAQPIAKDTGSSKVGSGANKGSLSAGPLQDTEQCQADFVDDEDDNFDVLPEMYDEPMEIAAAIQSEPEIQLNSQIHPDLEIEPKNEVKSQSVKSKSRKASMASSRTRASRKTQKSSGSERRRVSSVTQEVKSTPGRSNNADISIVDVEEEHEIVDLESEGEEVEVLKKKKKKPLRKAKSTKQTKKDGDTASKDRGQKRWRELKSLPTEQVNLNESGEDGGLRRSKRQRFPRLKFWKNETVSYERRLSQAIPTIAEVIVEVGGSESDDDTWFGRR